MCSCRRGTAPGMKSYGLITAIDAKTEKIVWQNKTPYRIENGSGAGTTAGGLLFHGEPDGNLQAYNSQDRREICGTSRPAPTRAGPGRLL